MNKRQVNYENDKTITAQRLREAMDDKDITASELAVRAVLNKASISQYLNAHQSPSNISAMKMAQVLRVSPMWLMGFDVPKYGQLKANEEKREYDLLNMFRQLSGQRQQDVLNFTNMLCVNQEKEILDQIKNMID